MTKKLTLMQRLDAFIEGYCPNPEIEERFLLLIREVKDMDTYDHADYDFVEWLDTRLAE